MGTIFRSNGFPSTKTLPHRYRSDLCMVENGLLFTDPTDSQSVKSDQGQVGPVKVIRYQLGSSHKVGIIKSAHILLFV